MTGNLTTTYFGAVASGNALTSLGCPGSGGLCGPIGVWGGCDSRAGLHALWLTFVRDSDVSILGWDMMDAEPNGYDIQWSVHGVIFAYGVALLDNSLLQPLAEACAEEGRYEFMLTINPLRVIGGTGSPVNPIAVF